jgi:hypothetical protein
MVLVLSNPGGPSLELASERKNQVSEEKAFCHITVLNMSSAMSHLTTFVPSLPGSVELYGTF